jgi:transposase
VANWLTDEYDTVIIGKLSMGVMKTKRKGKAVLQSLAHYRFRRVLVQVANKKGKRAHVVSEYMTTKQCNHCGFIDWKVGANKVFLCPNCKVDIHRDIHGARGIFLSNTQ